jgi:hypothetical protein
MKRVLVLVAVFCFGMLAFGQEDPNAIITQGQFAVKIVKVIKAKLPEGVSEQDAVSFLENLGLKPSAGWNISAQLNGRALSDLLVVVGGSVPSDKPEAFVTVQSADLVLQRNANLFRKFYLDNYTTGGDTATEIQDEGALRGLPISPSQGQ